MMPSTVRYFDIHVIEYADPHTNGLQNTAYNHTYVWRKNKKKCEKAPRMDIFIRLVTTCYSYCKNLSIVVGLLQFHQQ